MCISCRAGPEPRPPCSFIVHGARRLTFSARPPVPRPESVISQAAAPSSEPAAAFFVTAAFFVAGSVAVWAVCAALKTAAAAENCTPVAPCTRWTSVTGPSRGPSTRPVNPPVSPSRQPAPVRARSGAAPMPFMIAVTGRPGWGAEN